MSVFGRQMAHRAEAAQAQDSALSSLVQQAVANLQLTQSFTREPEESETFREQSAMALKRRRSQHGLEVLYLAAVAVVFALGTAAIIRLRERSERICLSRALTAGSPSLEIE